MDIQRYKRGQIWWLKDEIKDYTNHTQAGTRPAIIISNDSANRFSYNLTVIPCTSADKKELPTHVSLEINGPSTALVENIVTVSNSMIGSYIGTCDDKLMDKIDNAIEIALGLKPVPEKFKSTEITPIVKPLQIETKKSVETTKRGAKPKYSLEDKIRFVNDYENHGKEFMMKKYNLTSGHALNDRVYIFRKYIKEHTK